MSRGSYIVKEDTVFSARLSSVSGRRATKSSQSLDDNAGLTSRPMPEDDELNSLFEHLLDKMNLSPEKTSELQNRSKDDKWRLLRAKEVMHTRFTVEYYLDQLTRHMSLKLKVKHPKRKHMKGLAPISELLKSLEVDLRTNPNNDWSMMFVDEPNSGVVILIDFLSFLQSDNTERPKKKKYEILYKDGADEHWCILCVKSLMANRYGFSAVLGYEESLAVLALSLRAESPKTRAVVLKLLAAVLLTPGGHRKVLKAFDNLRTVIGEERNFETLIQKITEEPLDPPFQVAALCFLNTFVHSSAKMNARIFHQQELLAAGFDPDFIERSLKGRQDDAVLHELNEWRKEFIDVQAVMDEFIGLRTRASELRTEVDLLGKRIEDVNQGKSIAQQKSQQLAGQVDMYMNKAQELRTALQAVMKQYEKETGRKAPDGVELPQTLLEPIAPPPPIEIAVAAPPPPPPPPPGCPGGPPPPPPLPGMSSALALQPKKKKVISNVPLPMLNWVPLGQPAEQSYFHEMDETFVYKEIDFHDFEAQFEVKRYAQADLLQAKKEAALKAIVQKVTVIESNRARNLVIAKRRIGLSAALVQRYITNMDLDGLCAEHVELLLKFIPTKDELSKLAKHAHEYDKLAEAEQFLFQLHAGFCSVREMAKIERYESRLSVMAYMGYFDELVESVMPKIVAVYEASTSLVNSKRLKRLFEVILAFGNYMNSSRRGAAYGFRLESLRKLSDTRSQDRKQTFLHYLVDALDKYYPDVGEFTAELNVTRASGVSMQTLAQDVQGLRKGIDLTLFEREKQTSNFVLYSFYNRAVRKVTRLAEAYKKMDEAYTKACSLFCESPKTTEPSEFFAHFRDFVAAFKKADAENRERRKKELEEANKRQLAVRVKADPMMQSVFQEAAAVAASKGENRAPVTWKTHASPLTKRKDKKEKKEKKEKKKKEKKKKKEEDDRVKPGEVVMDESGMIQVAYQPDITQPSQSSALPPPPPGLAGREEAKLMRPSVKGQQKLPGNVENMRMLGSSPDWRDERASMSSKAGSIADSGFSQSSTPAAITNEELLLYDTADAVRLDSPAEFTSDAHNHQPLHRKGTADGYYVAVTAGGKTEDLYAKVESVQKEMRPPGGGASVRSEKAPPLPHRRYLDSTRGTMTGVTKYSHVDGNEQDELYSTADG